MAVRCGRVHGRKLAGNQIKKQGEPLPRFPTSFVGPLTVGVHVTAALGHHTGTVVPLRHLVAGRTVDEGAHAVDVVQVRLIVVAVLAAWS